MPLEPLEVTLAVGEGQAILGGKFAGNGSLKAVAELPTGRTSLALRAASNARWSVAVVVAGRLVAAGDVGGEGAHELTGWAAIGDPLWCAGDDGALWDVRVDFGRAEGAPLLPVGAEGRLLLRQRERTLTGTVLVGDDALAADGQLVNGDDGAPLLRLVATGALGGRHVTLTLLAEAEPDIGRGPYLVADRYAPALAEGEAEFPLILRQETGKVEPPADACGKLVETFVQNVLLKGGVQARIEVSRYERCTRLRFLDAKGDPLPGVSSIELPEDFRKKLNGATLIGHGAAATATTIARRGDKDVQHWGLFRVFFVADCPSPMFVQYVKSTTSVTPKGGTRQEAVKDWKVDGASPYRGSFPAHDSGLPGMIDGPGPNARINPFEQPPPKPGEPPRRRYPTDRHLS